MGRHVGLTAVNSEFVPVSDIAYFKFEIDDRRALGKLFEPSVDDHLLEVLERPERP